MSKSILAIDIGTTSVVCVIAQNDLNNKINILGVGKSDSDGIKNGAIVDIDKASFSIKNAVDASKSSSNTEIISSIVSISGIHTRSIRSNGFINIPSGLITKKEITQVLTMALYDASIIPDYDVIHVIPLYFKVDDNNTIDNPLNMNGTRLEVYTNIITAKKTSLNNIQSSLKRSNIEVDNFVLSSYASTLATLDDELKKLSTAVIDLGGSTSELALFKNKSLTYNTIIPIGSEAITKDLSIMLHTPFGAADEVKKTYSTLLKKTTIDENTITKVKVPILGNESDSKEVSLDLIQPMVHARVEEILCLLYEKLEQSGLDDTINTIILTGGMSKIPGIDALTKKVFSNESVKISNPKNIQNGYINFQDPSLSTIVGLLLYSLEKNPFFELNSNKQLKEQIQTQEKISIAEEVKITTNDISSKQDNTQIDSLESLNNIHKQQKEEKTSFVSKIWKKIGELL